MNLRYLLSSVALVVPCFWLPRIEAGDLASHAYNAWLAQLIARGQAPGLRIEPQWTNVLFDIELSALWGLGAAAAQKLAVAAAVLLFVWGAFAFAQAVARRKPWFLLPLLAMLAYGWVFHFGLFNFYIALGLAFWALALAWEPGGKRLAGAAVILALAATAHFLPVAWAIGAIAYRRLVPRLPEACRTGLLVAVVPVLLAARWLLESRFQTMWFSYQVGRATGTDQLLIYGARYQLPRLLLLSAWGLLLAGMLRRSGWRGLGLRLPFEIGLITALAVAILPDRILLPGYAHPLVYIAERMSLAVAICACAVLAPARPRLPEMAAIAAAAAVFFGFLYGDGRAANRIEEVMERAVAQVPPGSRVVSAVTQPQAHMIDRVCIGRCFSYANYEPSTGQFRIRAERENPVVLASYADSWAMQAGGYIVKQRDLPLYGVFPAAGGQEFTIRPLAATESFQVARLQERR
jgi:hypothetical protein